MCDKNSWLYRYPLSIHGRSGAFKDGYNLNHLNGLLNSIAWVWRGAASAQTFLSRAIQATHAAVQQASTSPAQRASSGTRPGGRTAILATLRPAGVTEQRVQQPKAWTAARRKPPIALLRRRRRPAPSAPCLPHAPKTLRNRASPIFGQVRKPGSRGIGDPFTEWVVTTPPPENRRARRVPRRTNCQPMQICGSKVWKFGRNFGAESRSVNAFGVPQKVPCVL